MLRTLIVVADPIDSQAHRVSSARSPGDIELQVNSLPSGNQALRVTTNVLVGTTGKPMACYTANAPTGYGDVACAQVSGATFGALNDSDGNSVQYVRTVIVDFVTAAR